MEEFKKQIRFLLISKTNRLPVRYNFSCAGNLFFGFEIEPYRGRWIYHLDAERRKK